MKRYFIISFTGQEHQVSKLEYYFWKITWLIPIIGFSLVLVGVIVDIIKNA